MSQQDAPNIPKTLEVPEIVDGVWEEGSDDFVSSVQSLVAKDRMHRGLPPKLTSIPIFALESFENDYHKQPNLEWQLRL
jgi:hypothetical protein